MLYDEKHPGNEAIKNKATASLTSVAALLGLSIAVLAVMASDTYAKFLEPAFLEGRW